MNKNYSRSIPETWRDISAIFAALGDEHRQRILLTFEPGERLNVGQIADVSTLARSTVSHHLKVLREAGLIVGTRRGRWIDYQLTDDAMDRLHAALPVPDSRACGCAVDPEPALAGARQ